MQWPLQGLLIGNGWISPKDQYPSYLEFAQREGLIKEGSRTEKDIEVQHNLCLSRLDAAGARNKMNIKECEQILEKILDVTATNGKCYNMYDIRLKDDHPSCGMSWPKDLNRVTPYLQRQDVVEALNINPGKKTGWTECTGAVSMSFKAEHSVPAIKLLPQLLNSGLRVLLFSGDRDLICNHRGTEALIHNMKWLGGTGFETSPGEWAARHDWTFEGEPTGVYQHARNLTYALFYNASHMVPYDVPRQSRDMIDRFMRVDIASIGGQPADSRIDGAKLPITSVGGTPNSTFAEQLEKEKMKQTEMHAYAKSGEAILVLLIIGVSAWGFLIWRSRRSRRRRSSAYRGVYHGMHNGSVLDRFQNKRSDVEAGDFDESELDQLHPSGMDREHYAVGDASDEDELSPLDSDHRHPL